MGHPRFTGDTIAQRGQKIYADTIQAQAETEANIGKILCLDIETGDYAIADDGLTASDILLSKRPDAALYALRIGYDAVYSFGGVLTRTKQ